MKRRTAPFRSPILLGTAHSGDNMGIRKLGGSDARRVQQTQTQATSPKAKQTGLFKALGRTLSRLFGSTPNTATASTAQLGQQVAKQPENASAVIGAVEAVMVMRGFVPGTKVPQRDMNNVAEFRQVWVEKGQEHNSNAPVLATGVDRAQAPKPQVPLQSSSASLTSMLQDVWQQRDQLAGKGSDPIYSMYNAVVEPNALTTSPKAYLGALSDIASSRPEGATSNMQSFGGSGNAISTTLEMYDQGKLPEKGQFAGKKVLTTFYRFERQNMNPANVKERVYLNAKADHAPDLMRHVVKNIIDNPDAFPGVEMAKLSGPNSVGNRCENIVIYTSGDEATQRVLQEVERLQAENPTMFNTSVPKMTEQKAPGIAIGAEPTQYGGRRSFGSLRADVIAGALAQTLRGGGNEQDFMSVVAQALRSEGIPPDAPHKNDLPTFRSIR